MLVYLLANNGGDDYLIEGPIPESDINAYKIEFNFDDYFIVPANDWEEYYKTHAVRTPSHF